MEQIEMQQDEAPAPEATVARPFIRWAGGKWSLRSQLVPLVPDKFGTYHELFLGSGAMFLALRPAFAVLSDANSDLVNTWSVIRNNIDGVIERLKQHYYEEQEYYRVRALPPSSLDSITRAARFIYLNKTGFNGLYRVNKRGKFNVPFGKYTNPTICDEENLRAVSRLLKDLDPGIHALDFKTALGWDDGVWQTRASKGDFFYFDPPYVPVSKTANFTGYGKDGFGEDEQMKLSEACRALGRKGVFVMVSNSDTPLVRTLYKGFTVTEVSRSGSMNSKASGRGRVSELVLRNYG